MRAKIFIVFLAFTVSAHAYAQNFNYETAADLEVALGMYGNAGSLLRKQLGTASGKDITIGKMLVWGYDGTNWEKGGKLHLINDDSIGRAYRITCSVSPEVGDRFMQSPNRREISISGKIKKYSSVSGLMIDPCNASW